MIYFGARGYEQFGFKVLPEGRHNVYLFKLWNIAPIDMQTPNCVYKVGVTSAVDPYDRLRYNAIADRITIGSVFPYAALLSHITLPSRGAAKAFESYLLSLVGPKDFLIETRISGITEMRRWDEDEVNVLIAEFAKKQQLTI